MVNADGQPWTENNSTSQTVSLKDNKKLTIQLAVGDVHVFIDTIELMFVFLQIAHQC